VIGRRLGRRLWASAALDSPRGFRPIYVDLLKTVTVVRDMAASRGALFFAVNVAIFGAIILDMVLKPF
jgi:hypothetical protein